MKKTTWLIAIPLGLVGLAAWGGWRAFDVRENESAFGLLEEARALIAESPEKAVLAQRMLDRGLALEPPPALTEALLTERAELRTDTGARALALDDWRRIAAMHPDDDAIKLQIAGLESQLGNRDRALEIYQSILDAKPTNGWVRSFVAYENESTARGLELATLASLEELVSPADLQWLRPVLSRLVRLPEGSAVREGLLSELAMRFDDDVLAVLRPAIATLTEDFLGIREDLAASLQNSVNRNNLAGMIDLYYQSDRYEDCVDFGLAALPFATSLDHPRTIQDLALALNSLGRPKAAAEIVNRAVADKPTWHVDFLDDWCSILCAAENWQQLENAATQLMRSPGTNKANSNQESDGAFYFGLATFHQGRNSAAVGALKQFITSRTAGPQPDAIGWAWSTIAQAQTNLEDKDAASSAWRSCAQAAPDYSAQAWLEWSRSAAKNPQAGMSESEALAHVIALDPTSAAMRLQPFIAAGQRGLQLRGIELPALAAKLKSEGRWYPQGTTPIYTLYALALLQLEAGEPAGAGIIYQRILRDLPTFVPALDGLALTRLLLNEPLAQAEVMLDRLALTGPDPVVLAGLKDLSGKLEGQELPPALLQRWMELDPGFVGATELARTLASIGRTTEALVTLSAVPRNLFNDRDRVLFAEILTGLGDASRVLEATQGVSPKGPYMLRAALLRTQAAVALADFDQLMAAIESIESLQPQVEPGSPEDALVESAFSSLLAARLGPAVLRFSRVFATASGARNGRRMNLAALAEVLFGDPAKALDWVNAADALSHDGSSIVGRLVLAEALDDVEVERATMRDLRSEAPEWVGEVELALMSALEGRTGEARAAIDTLLEESPSDSRLWLARSALDAIVPLGAEPDYASAAALLGTAAVKPLERIASLGAQGGRRLLTILLASSAPVWDAWAINLVHGPIQQALLGPYAVELDARSQLAKGDLEGARTSLMEGANRWKAFLPFWDLNEDLTLAKYGRPDHPAVVSLRRKRRQAGAPPRGGKPPSASELALDASFEAAAGGEMAEAFVQAKQARKSAPNAAAPRLNLARVARDLAPKVSQTAYLDYLLGEDWALETSEVHELLAELVSLSVPLHPEALEALMQRYPNAPEPVLAQAKLDLETAGLEVAFERLETFTESHPALESIAVGTSRPWFDFLLAYSPARALDFASVQLELDPHWLEPWAQKAEALGATGQLEASLDLWRILAEMSPSPTVALGHAAIVASLGGDHKEVLDALRLARQGAMADANSGLIEFITARSLANIGDVYFEQAINKLDVLLTAKETPGVSRTEIKRRLGTTLLHRAAPGDGPRAVALLLAASKEEEDSLERDLLIGLSNLGRNLESELKNRAEREAASAATD